jgi:PAS domain S-box-containing protein
MLSLFTLPTDPSLISYGLYTPKLVLLSVLVAIFASWMALLDRRPGVGQPLPALDRARHRQPGARHRRLGHALHRHACFRPVHGCRLRSHDHHPVRPAEHRRFLVALNFIARERLGGWGLLIGGTLVGAGIGAMHYSGMEGMRMNLDLRYDPWMFGLSIVVAVVLATLALWVRFGLSNVRWLRPSYRLLLAGTVMGCAIAGMHYTGMAAARFVGHPAVADHARASSDFLALAITMITVVFTILVLGLNGLLRYRQLFRELSKSEAWMRALLTTTVDGVITVDRSGTILEFNASAERIYGWKRDEIIGKDIRILIGNEEKSEQVGLLHALNTGEITAHGNGADVTGRRKDGSIVPLRRAIGHASSMARSCSSASSPTSANGARWNRR